jgi:hypothetical protein
MLYWVCCFFAEGEMKKIAFYIRRQGSANGKTCKRNSMFKLPNLYLFGIISMMFSLIAISDNTLAADHIDTDLNIGREVSLLAPMQSYFSQHKGIDSLIGTIHTLEFNIHVDYGAYSANLKIPIEQKQFTRKEVIIDGLLANILVYKTSKNQQHQNGQWYIGINFPNVRDSVIGSIRLTMYAWLQNENQVKSVENIFRSIHFKR